MGHATAAYLGYIYNKDYIYVYEALRVKQINSLVRETMFEAAEILHSMYPDEFTINDLTVHIIDLIERMIVFKANEKHMQGLGEITRMFYSYNDPDYKLYR